MCFAALSVTLVVLSGCGRDAPTATGSATPTSLPGVAADALASFQWSEIPKAPISVRGGASIAWSGHELLAWGGQSGEHGEVLHGDGAAYDPATKTWRVLPDSPLSPRTAQASVFTDAGWFVWGGYDRLTGTFKVSNQGALYDPSADKWTQLPPSPLSPRATATAFWTGTEVIVLSGHPAVLTNDTRGKVDSAAFNPSTNTWRTLPALPAVSGHKYEVPAAVWTGDELFAWWPWDATETNGSETLGTSGYDLFAYSPAHNQWRAIRDTGRTTGVGDPVWTGTEIIVPATPPFNGAMAGPPPRDLQGGRYRPATNTWNRIAHGRVDDITHTTVWTGGSLVSISMGLLGDPQNGDVTPGDTSAWDPTTDTWAKLPSAPYAPSGDNSLVWTRHELLGWGQFYRFNSSASSTPVEVGMRFGP